MFLLFFNLHGKALINLRVEGKQAFDALMDACYSYASAGSNATQLIFNSALWEMYVRNGLYFS
jgi:hypothetical protein